MNGSEPIRLVIEEQEAWVSFWKAHTGEDEAPRPPVNFEDEQVVAAIFGSEPAPCGSMRITGVERSTTTDATVVEVTTYEAPPDTGCVAVEMQHTHIVAIPKGAVPVTFREEVAMGPPTEEPGTLPTGGIAWSFGWVAAPDVPLMNQIPVHVTVANESVPVNGSLAVSVANVGNRTITFSGESCSLHIAKINGPEWRVFGAAPGNFEDSFHSLAPGETCSTQVPLDKIHVRDSQTSGLRIERLDPLPHRVVFLGNAQVEGDPVTVLGSAPFEVE